MGELRVIVGTAHFDESVHFYTTTLGLPVASSWGTGERRNRGALIAATAEARIELLEGVPAPVGLTVAIQTDDVETAAVRLVGRLTQGPTDQPWGHRNCATVDPNGVSIVLFQVTAQEPAAG